VFWRIAEVRPAALGRAWASDASCRRGRLRIQFAVDGRNSHQQWAELFGEIPIEEDRWVRSYQSRPLKDGVQFVHHMVAYIILTDGITDGYGLRTVDDMAIAMGEGVKLSDEEFARMAEERTARFAADTKP
jgi:hypothetical protein